MNQLQKLTLQKYPEPPSTLLERFQHTLDIYSELDDSYHVLTATMNIYPEAKWTGLTLGDLRGVMGLLSWNDEESGGCADCGVADDESWPTGSDVCINCWDAAATKNSLKLEKEDAD